MSKRKKKMKAFLVRHQKNEFEDRTKFALNSLLATIDYKIMGVFSLLRKIVTIFVSDFWKTQHNGNKRFFAQKPQKVVKNGKKVVKNSPYIICLHEFFAKKQAFPT